MKKKLILLSVITVAVVTTITIINVGEVENDDTITVTKPTVVENENDVEDVQENQLVVVEDTPVVEVEPSKTEKTKSSNTTTSTKATNDTTNTSVTTTTTTTTTTAEPTVSKTNNSTDNNKITFRVTAYCACSKCCGSYANNRPKDEAGNPIVVGAAGTQLVSGVSCASPLPFGTQISLDGYGTVVVQDRTAQWVVNKHGTYIADIYFSDHETARQFGLQYIEGVIK